MRSEWLALRLYSTPGRRIRVARGRRSSDSRLRVSLVMVAALAVGFGLLELLVPHDDAPAPSNRVQTSPHSAAPDLGPLVVLGATGTVCLGWLENRRGQRRREERRD
jgi:hypothetical protein